MKTGNIFTTVLLLAAALSLMLLVQAVSQSYFLPGNNTGYEPVQPIAFSHRLHAGELAIECLHCHSGAETSRTAGIPSVGVCMNCHRFVSAPYNQVQAEDVNATRENRKPRRVISPEIARIYNAMALNDSMDRDPSRKPEPVAWVKVHALPDFVTFDHRAHVHAGVDCQTCHGQVQTMERVRQVENLTMGWCVNCHRDASARGVKGRPVNASTDCVVCHY